MRIFATNNLPADITYFFQGAPQDTSALYVISSPDELAEIKGYLDTSNPNVRIYASSRSNAASNTPEYYAKMNGLNLVIFHSLNKTILRNIKKWLAQPVVNPINAFICNGF